MHLQLLAHIRTLDTLLSMNFYALGFSSGLEHGVALLVAFALAVILHEVAHGYAALYLGDPTAKLAGRLTLNPIAHIDPIGSIIVPLVLWTSQIGMLFGWAKPVPVNYYNLRKGKYGPLLVALAGPATNLALLIIAALLARVSPQGTQLPSFFIAVAVINGVLMLFNLIPIPPLDGSKVLFTFLEDRPEVIAWLERYGFYVLIAIMFFGSGILTNLVFVPTLRLTSLFSGYSLTEVFGLLR